MLKAISFLTYFTIIFVPAVIVNYSIFYYLNKKLPDKFANTSREGSILTVSGLITALIMFSVSYEPTLRPNSGSTDMYTAIQSSLAKIQGALENIPGRSKGTIPDVPHHPEPPSAIPTPAPTPATAEGASPCGADLVTATGIPVTRFNVSISGSSEFNEDFRIRIINAFALYKNFVSSDRIGCAPLVISGDLQLDDKDDLNRTFIRSTFILDYHYKDQSGKITKFASGIYDDGRIVNSRDPVKACIGMLPISAAFNDKAFLDFMAKDFSIAFIASQTVGSSAAQCEPS